MLKQTLMMSALTGAFLLTSGGATADEQTALEDHRQLSWGMHDAASEFAQVAKGGDAAKTYTALQKVTSSCVACHMSFRTR